MYAMDQMSRATVSLALCLGVLLTRYYAEAVCPATTINETAICENVNSTGVVARLPTITLGNITSYACARDLSALTSGDLLHLLESMANGTISFTTAQLTLLFTKLNETQLERGLEAFSNAAHNATTILWKDIFLTALWNAKLSTLTYLESSELVEAWLKRLRPFLSAVPPVILLCLRKVSMTCPVYQAIIKGLDSQFDDMSAMTQENVYSFVSFYMQNLNATTSPGAVCTNGLANSSLWLNANFGSFSKYAMYKDLVSLNTNFHGLDALGLLTPTQLADVTVDSEALRSEANITAILNTLKKRSFADFTDYFAHLHQRNVSSVNITVGSTMLNLTLEQLIQQRSQFNSTDYSIWFQQYLLFLLPGISSSQLASVLDNASCTSYQAVVVGLGTAYSSMTEAKRMEVYGALKSFLNRTPAGPCVPSNQTNENMQWLLKNFASFRSGAKYEDFTRLKANFSGFDVLDLLTSPQLADLTVLSQAIASDSNITAIFNSLNSRPLSDLATYYTQLNMWNISAVNITVGATMLNLTLERLSPQLDRFNSTDYAVWFQQNLLFLLPDITSTQLEMVFKNASCSSYQAVVTGLDSVYSAMTIERRHEVYGALWNYLNHTANGSVCVPVNSTNENRDWLLANFRNFRASAEYFKLLQLKPTFSGLDALDLLTPNQLADVTVDSEALRSEANITAIFNTLQNRTFADFSDYYSRFHQWNISPENITVGVAMLNLTLKRLYPQLDLFNSTDYAVWFQQNLLFLLPDINSTQLEMVFKNVSCASYQAVIPGLNTAYPKMSDSKRLEVYGSLKEFMRTEILNGSACVDGSSNVSDWMVRNFGNFRSKAQIHDFTDLSKNIPVVDVLGLLTPKRLAQLSAISGVLKSPSDVQEVMRYLPDSAAVVEYIDEFNLQPNISSLPADIRYELLNQVLLKANLSAASDAVFSTWIDSRLPNLLPASNSTLLQSLFLSVNSKNCSTFHNMIRTLSNYISIYDNFTYDAIYSGILGYVKGLRCFTNSSNFQVYLNETFQGFDKHLNLDDAFSTVPPGKISEVLNSMSGSDFADFLTPPNFMNNDTLLSSLLLTFHDNGRFLDTFNKAPAQSALSNDTKAAILKGVWPDVMNNDNSTDIDTWLSSRLQPYYPFINKDLLDSAVTRNATCLSFTKIVKNVAANITLFPGKEADFYNSIKTYLTAEPVQPRCYNSSDTSWFASYLGTFIQYCTVDDLLKLTGNASVLGAMSVNEWNLELINSTTLQTGVAELYASALFSQNPNVTISRLPDKLLCFSGGSQGFHNLPADQLLPIVQKINELCGASSTSNGTAMEPSPSSLQLAAQIVGKITVFNASTVANLGQQAVGLNAGQIEDMSADVVVRSVGNLGKVQGWDAGQGQSLVKKLIDGGYKFDSSEKFKQLGTLVFALPSTVIANMPADTAKNLSRDQDFVTTMVSSEVYLKQAFVQKIVGSSPTPDTVLNTVPDSLADAIPNSQVTFGNPLNITAISKKSWSKDQASGFFDEVLKSTANHNDLSSSVLQGFQCSSGVSLMPDNFKALLRAMKNKNVPLDGLQSSCLVKLGRTASANITDYPSNVLLFLNPSDITISCEDYFKMASAGDVSTLTSDPIQKSILLGQINTCYISKNNGKLDKTALSNLGGLVCLLDATVIAAADPQIVENLKQCADLTDVQQSTLLTLLNSGKTTYGTPSSWNLDTFKNLGQLSYYLDSTTLASVSDEVKKEMIENAVVEFRGKSVTKEKVQNLVNSILSKRLPKRRRRATGCTVGNITASTLQDPLFVLTYSDVTQFDACLSNDVLKANLAALADQPLPIEYLQVMKTRLNMIYPNGIPEDSVKIMGAGLQRLFSDSDISKWNITSEDTLTVLMKAGDPAWNASQAKQILTNYLKGKTFTATALKNVGGPNLCTLDALQISTINATALKDAGSLDVSTCSQDKKDVFFSTAKSAFASQLGTPAYYPSIKPYLGGASASDLRSLGNVSMDIQTFIALNPNSVKLLSTKDVSALLGVNVADLKTNKDNAVVRGWIANQKQSDLDALQLGLTGGWTVSSQPGGFVVVPIAPGSGAVTPSFSVLQLWLGAAACFVAGRILG